MSNKNKSKLKQKDLTPGEYLAKSREILTTHIKVKHPDALSLNDVMDSYTTVEACQSLLAELSPDDVQIVTSPANVVYDVMKEKNIKGYIELLLWHMFDFTFTPLEQVVE